MGTEEFVPLRFVQSMKEAEQLKTILEDHDVEVEIVDDDLEPNLDGKGAGLAIMVASDYLEEAKHILEQRSSIDDELELDYAQTEDTDNGNSEDERVAATDREATLEELYELGDEEEEEEADANEDTDEDEEDFD